MLHKENCFIAEIEGIFDRKILEEVNNITNPAALVPGQTIRVPIINK